VLTDDERSALAARFKLAFMSRADMALLGASDEARERNAKQAALALEVVAFFEKEMPCKCSESSGQCSSPPSCSSDGVVASGGR